MHPLSSAFKRLVRLHSNNTEQEHQHVTREHSHCNPLVLTFSQLTAL